MINVKYQFTETITYEAELEVDESEFAAWLAANNESPGDGSVRADLGEYVREQDFASASYELDSAVVEFHVISFEGTAS